MCYSPVKRELELMRTRFPRGRLSTLKENFLSLDHRYGGGGGVSINNIYNQSTIIQSSKVTCLFIFCNPTPL